MRDPAIEMRTAPHGHRVRAGQRSARRPPHAVARARCGRRCPPRRPNRRHQAARARPDHDVGAGCPGRRPRRVLNRPALRPGLDRGVDVDVVALRLPMAAIQADPEPSQRTPQGVNVGPRQRVPLGCGADRSRARCTSPADSADDGRPTQGTSCPRPSPVVRIVDVGQRGRRRGHRTGAANPLVRPMSRRIRPRRATAAELTNPAHQALQQFPRGPATTDGAGERIHHVVSDSSAASSSSASPFCDSRRGAWTPASERCAAECADNRFRASDHTEGARRIIDGFRPVRHRE